MTDTNADANRSAASQTAPDAPATCKFKKVRLAGLPPRKSAVEALMKSLESRGVLGPEGHTEREVSRRAPEAAASRPPAAVDSSASATILEFSSHRKASKFK
jgi:hypothetical protein